MPLYRFSVDVPAPLDVVAERLRSAPREPPGLWESLVSSWRRTNSSDPPFVGAVKDNSFRLQRNIHYRNSFLPQIRGRMIFVASGTRVNVVMFMHPLVFIFMLFWLASAGYSEWRVSGADYNASLIPLLLIAFGLALSLGGFLLGSDEGADSAVRRLVQCGYQHRATAANRPAADGRKYSSVANISQRFRALGRDGCCCAYFVHRLRPVLRK